jgi:hypothetical protein
MDTFTGITFCSVQYLKSDKNGKKKEFLKKMNYYAIITDESHQGSSTHKTKQEILDIEPNVEEIRETIKLNIFASGTPDKTIRHYKIPLSCVDIWEIEDESSMKSLTKPSKEVFDYMTNRHSSLFIKCFEDDTLNRDYSKHPTQVFMKGRISRKLIDEINEYNSVHGTKYGYSCSSLFALSKKKITDSSGNDSYEYDESFELCKTADGNDILIEFLDNIISKNKMKNTIMKQIEQTQYERGSRQSTTETPLLNIIYLPTHTGNNNIALLQKTLVKFLEMNDLWFNYNIEYTSSMEDSADTKENYNQFIETIMSKTKRLKKRGCILLLGNKGTTGITYTMCDSTISLDDGHNLDNQRQRNSRALTEAPGKTVGVNVDMNIQRHYSCMHIIIHKFRKYTKTTKTNAEILLIKIIN